MTQAAYHAGLGVGPVEGRIDTVRSAAAPFALGVVGSGAGGMGGTMGRRTMGGGAGRVVVIGLGRFGESTARTLYELGYEVTGIDIGEGPVAAAAAHVTLAAQGDGSDEELLRSLNVDRSDVGIVAQGENLEANVLATLILKRLGVPWVVARAKSGLHAELLARLGADRVVLPEGDAGFRLAHSLSARAISDYITLSPTTGVAKLTAPPHLAGRTLGELQAAQADHLSVLLVKRGQDLIAAPGPEERIRADDELVLAGADAAIAAFGVAGGNGEKMTSRP